MSVTAREILGTQATLLSSTELGGLANAGQVVGGTAYNNTAGSGISSTTGDGYERGYLTFAPGAAFASAPASGASLDVYLLKSVNGAYEGGSSSVLPGRAPDATIPLVASVSAADNTATISIFAPGCPIKAMVVNNSGLAIPSGSTLLYTPCTDQGS